MKPQIKPGVYFDSIDTTLEPDTWVYERGTLSQLQLPLGRIKTMTQLAHTAFCVSFARSVIIRKRGTPPTFIIFTPGSEISVTNQNALRHNSGINLIFSSEMAYDAESGIPLGIMPGDPEAPTGARNNWSKGGRGHRGPQRNPSRPA